MKIARITGWLFAILWISQPWFAVAQAADYSMTIVLGNGQIVDQAAIAPDDLVVAVKGPDGKPVTSGTVAWTLTPAFGWGVVDPSTALNEKGESHNRFRAESPMDLKLVPLIQTKATASFTPSGSTTPITQTFYITTCSVNDTGVRGIGNPEILYPASGETITGKSGTKGTTPIKVRILSLYGQPVPNVGLRIEAQQDVADTDAPRVACNGGTVLSDSTGVASCDVLFSGREGEGQYTLYVGGQFLTKPGFYYKVLLGPLGVITITSPNPVSGSPGAGFTLRAVLYDLSGNVLSSTGDRVVWENQDTTKIELSRQTYTPDANGVVSAYAKLLGSAGTATVRLKAEQPPSPGAAIPYADFLFTTNVSVGGIQIISGNAQEAIVNQDFKEPLVVQVNDPAGKPVLGASVQFTTVEGDVVIATPNAVADSNGRAQTTVKAGAKEGKITISATASGKSTTFNLVARPPGALVGPDSFYRAADGEKDGVAPGSLVDIMGTGIAPSLQGSVAPVSLIGDLQYTVFGVSVFFGDYAAPIYAVSGWGDPSNRIESVRLQVPFEIPVGPVQVTVRVGGTSETKFMVQVKPVAPGMIEYKKNNVSFGYLLRSNDTWVSEQNPAAPGEILRAFVTGLGQTNPPMFSNAVGASPGGTVVLNPEQPGSGLIYNQVNIGFGNGGTRIVRISYAPYMIGVYVVEFQVPSDAPSGRAFTSVTSFVGDTLYSNGHAVFFWVQ